MPRRCWSNRLGLGSASAEQSDTLVDRGGITAANAINEALAKLAAQLFAAMQLSLEQTPAHKERGASPVTRAAPRAEAVTNLVDRTARPACLYLWQELRDIVAFIGRQISNSKSAAPLAVMSTPE